MIWNNSVLRTPENILGMKSKLLSVFILLSLFSFGSLPHKNISVLATGKWYKIAIREKGIHRITYEDFVNMGFDLSRNNDSTIRVFGNGGGMLPESNLQPRVDDLREISIQVVDGGDGRLDPGDYVLFYGESPDNWTYDYTTHLFTHFKNLYSDYTYYFVTSDNGKGKRIGTQASLDSIPNYYSYRLDDHVFHELDQRNLVQSGRVWYGEVFDNSKTSYDFPFLLPDVDSISPVRIVTYVAARSIVNSKFILSVNGIKKDSMTVDYYDPNDNQDFARFKQKVSQVFHVSSPVTLNLTYKLPYSTATGWLNFIEINCRRSLVWHGPQMGFRDGNSIGSKNKTLFTLSGATPDVKIWNISDQSNIKKIEGHLSHDTIRFIAATDSLKEFFAFDGSAYDSVHLVEAVKNQNLHAIVHSTPLIIVTNPLFVEDANRLADFHRQKNNMPATVVTTTEIYNEFSSGKPDLTAIRDFMKMLYDRGYPDNPPEYLLLFGDGSYDPKDRIPGNNNLIPTYQSVESLNTTRSYVTEDYYGIMADSAGANANGIIDIGIGRLPVSTVEQAKNIVDKIIHYSSVSDSVMSDWRNVMTFIADDEEDNLFLQETEKLTTIVKQKYPVFNVNKIYLDAYPLVITPAGERFPDVNKAINKAVADGSLIINYVGHGGDDGLANEKVVTIGDIQGWNNADKLPVFLTATCEFSQFDNPERYSAGETVLNQSPGGAIALYTSTRTSIAITNSQLDTCFFNNLIPPDGGPPLTMGDLIRITKNRNGNNAFIRNFVLLGDPAQNIAFPKNRIVTTEVNQHPVTGIPDTTRGLSLVNIKGQMQDVVGNKSVNFTGTLSAKIFDKPGTYRTLGNKSAQNGNSPQAFQLQNSLLAEQKVSVINGDFAFSFVIPKDIALKFGNGKISYYAKDTVTDANGYFDDIIIGGTDPGIIPGNSGPAIRLFMNDTNFISGGLTSADPLLIAFLEDPDGINATGIGIGHEILAVLDDNTPHPVVLNDLYLPEIDSYRKGTVKYPMSNLATGLHKLNLTAWDLYNNPSRSEISFFVFDQPVLTVGQVINYPNPVSDHTTFYFTPKQNTGTIDIRIQIFSLHGVLVKTIELNGISESGNVPIGISWDGRDASGNRLVNGLYIYRLIARGGNGTYTETSQKLMMLN
jgi:hypothetical protein